MKDLVMDILELYNDEHLALTDIAAQLGITVEMVEEVLELYSEV
jgi:predicted transcriptional regulator